MKSFLFILIFPAALLSGCTDPGNQGESSPIDSTNTYGTAPVIYGADDPTDDTLSKENRTDTGTKVNEGPDNTR